MNETLTIAVVGSGPSGCYISQFLLKKFPHSEVVIFDRLEHPYGLVRYGVAPDHAGTKAVAKQFDRLFESGGVRFVGQTEIGRDITMHALRAAFDIVVLATGLSADRPLGISGSDLSGVFGSGRITRFINGHPEENTSGLLFGSHLTIVGHGNVALDITRILLTHPEDLRGHGVGENVLAAFGASPVQHIDIVGRSAPGLAKFDTAMVRELSKITNVRFIAHDLPTEFQATEGADDAKHEAIVALAAGSPKEATRTVHFYFGYAPESVNGVNKVESITFRATKAPSATPGNEKTLELATNAVFTAIGFAEAEGAAVKRDDHTSIHTNLETGLLDDGVYCVGWLRRGPKGTIPANRADAKMVAGTIAAAIEVGSIVAHKPGFSALEFSICSQQLEEPS